MDSSLKRDFSKLNVDCENSSDDITLAEIESLLEYINQTVVDKYSNGRPSEYEQKFKEIKLLGEGSFGEVYVAKHKIDGMKYAIKKIIRSRKIPKIQQSLQEVITLAQLDHPNIVTYKTAWLEKLEPSQSSKDDSMSGINTSIEYFESNASDEQLSEDISSYTDEQLSEDISSYTDEQLNEDDFSQESLDIKTEGGLILYIQMGLSDTNLRSLIDESSLNNEPFDELVIRSTAIQILRGLNYIKSKQIVHHDIKPDNILIRFNAKEHGIQIADFGLSCHSNGKIHSVIGGTPLYSAPEQLEDKCDSKNDIFSFGIVLFELLYPIESPRDRYKEIQSLKKGNDLPPAVINNYPDWDDIVKKSINENPQLRPSAEDLILFIYKKKNEMNML